jgi:hypothetical protein
VHVEEFLVKNEFLVKEEHPEKAELLDDEFPEREELQEKELFVDVVKPEK